LLASGAAPRSSAHADVFFSGDENLDMKHGETCRRSFNFELSRDLSTELNQPMRASGVIAPAAQTEPAGALQAIPFAIQTRPEQSMPWPQA
jgi:hypothetical protein